jgi:hypothetical protein
LPENDRQGLLHVVANGGENRFPMCHGPGLFASQRLCLLLTRLRVVRDVPSDGLEQALRRGYRCPDQPPVRGILTSEAVLEAERRLTARKLL